MSAILLTALSMFVASPLVVSARTLPTREQSSHYERAPRPFHDLTADVRTALRQEAKASRSADDRTSALVQLVLLYDEIKRDARRQTSPTLERLRMKVRARLVRVKNRLKKQLAIRSSAAQDRRPHARPNQPVPSQQAEELDTGVAGNAASQSELNGGGPVAADNGAALVELIERTIRRETWDVNGGPSTIVYYAPRYALVVRAPAEIHHRMGGLLQDLREANCR